MYNVVLAMLSIS